MLKLVVGESAIEVPWPMMERWSRFARLFRADYPDLHTMPLSNSISDAGAVRAFVRLGSRHRTREDGSRMNDSDALGALRVAHLLDATLEWFAAANEPLQYAWSRGRSPATHLAWLEAFALDIKIARFTSDRIMAAWHAVAYDADACVDASWRAMNSALDALTADGKTGRDTAIGIMGCRPYVVACIRVGRSQPISCDKIPIRLGSIHYELYYARRKSCGTLPTSIFDFLINEVNAGRIPEQDCNAHAMRLMGSSERVHLEQALRRLTLMFRDSYLDIEFV